MISTELGHALRCIRAAQTHLEQAINLQPGTEGLRNLATLHLRDLVELERAVKATVSQAIDFDNERCRARTEAA